MTVHLVPLGAIKAMKEAGTKINKAKNFRLPSIVEVEVLELCGRLHRLSVSCEQNNLNYKEMKEV